MAVALWVVRDVCNDLVPELFVEWPCLKAESRQEDSVAPLRCGFVFGSYEEFRSVSLPPKRLRHPQGAEVEPPSPDVTKGPAEHRAPLVLEEDGERAVVGVLGNRHVEERQSVAHKCGVLRVAPGSETILRSVMIYYLSVSRGLCGYIQDYLAYSAAFFHKMEGRGDIFEREGLVYLWMQAVLGIEVEHRAKLFGGAHRSPEHV